MINCVIKEEYNSDLESEYSSESDISDNESTIENTVDQDNNLEEPAKKKRGRKCKQKDDTIIVEKIQKKRGRKPKIKEADDIEKIPKKRGRKPKEKIYSVKELPKTFFEENKNEAYILHLPIKSLDKKSNSPLPNNINNDYSIYNESIDNYDLNTKNLLLTQTDLLNNNLFENNIVKDDVYRGEVHREELKESKELKEEDIKINKVIKKNLRNILYEFIQSNNDKTWPESTNIHCWWCCHQFNNTPCAIPEYYKKEKFYVNGCFCSFNCAASYNFNKNDNNMWERYSLLNLMYKKLFNQKSVKIDLAPPREVLKMFGGYMSIEEFRENSLRSEKVFTVIKPPLISIISKIEENISNINKSLKNNNSTINENILNKTQNTLKLKRNKPITNPNSTLQSFMDLKII